MTPLRIGRPSLLVACSLVASPAWGEIGPDYGYASVAALYELGTPLEPAPGLLPVVPIHAKRPVPVRKPPQPEPAENPSVCGPKAESITRTVLSRYDKPQKVLKSLGLPWRVQVRLRRALSRFRKQGGQAEFRRLLAGHEVQVGFGLDNKVLWVRHRPYPELAICLVPGARGTYRVRRVELPIERRKTVISGVVTGQSWADTMTSLGESRALGVRMGSLFSFRRVQRWHRVTGKPVAFKLLVEKDFIDNETFGYGAIEAIEVDAGDDRSFFAMRFPQPEFPDAYYTRSGRPVRRARVAPPVLDAIVTSRYGPRRHPIQRRWRMHRGIDYGTRRGVPVFAVATGTVSFADRRDALGKLVTVEHPDRLATRYAHLSRIAVREGQVVQTGDLLGYVGSSGMSTGPHLHFETIVDGRHRNPTWYHPPYPPNLSEQGKQDFAQRIAELEAQFDKRVSARPPLDGRQLAQVRTGIDDIF